jgi:predicted nucleic acid-binding protein
VRFWDSSAIVPLIVEEEVTAAMQEAYARDAVVLAWWGTEIECVSALARRERSGHFSTGAMTVSLERLDALRSAWHEVEAGEGVRQTARRLLRVHDLRAGDALQLAAAIVASEGQPASLEVVALDDRLATAARREGFGVIAGGRTDDI